MSGVRVGGVWKTPTTTSVRVGGVWKTASVVSVKVGGVWKTTTLGGAPPPVIEYVSTGVFEVANTQDGIYTTSLVSGSGSVTQSTVNGKRRFTLSGANSRFSITFSYAAGAPQSVASFMERKAYEYSCREVPYTCCSACNCRTEGADCFCVAPDADGCPPGTSPNGQCGCGGATPCMGGSIGTVVCDTCCSTCFETVCDVLIDQPGYINSGTEWYKVT
jgi:hypothetical protein